MFGTRGGARQRARRTTSVFIGSLLACATSAGAGTLTLAWDPNPESDLAGYLLWYGTQPGSYTASIDVGTLTSYKVPNLTDGATYYFAVQAYNSSGAKGAFSREIAGAVPGLVLTGPVAAFGFEEGAGTVASDGSPNANHATLSGGTWTASGRYGGGVSLDGIDDWLTVRDAATLDLTKAMTLEAWVKPSTLSGWRTVLMKEGGGALAYALYAHDNAPRSAAYARLSGQTSSNGAAGTAALPLNAWTHLTATYDNATLRLYVNGTEVSRQAVTGSMVTTTGALRIGGNVLWGEYFEGTIDEVRVYNRALSAAEIRGDMGAPVTSGLVAAYGFEEGTGTTVADASGRGHTGTISGAAWAAAGRYGKALRFDGVNDRVGVADSNALDLSARFTLEAWVNPVVLTGWRTVLMKETADGLAYAVYANDNAPQPAAYTRIDGAAASDGSSGVAALPVNAWTHLAATYDGSTLRVFVNGVEVGSEPVSGNVVKSANVLSIGGSLVWGEYFEGLIDEVRVYNRALTAAEIDADMNMAVRPCGPRRTSPRPFAYSRMSFWNSRARAM
jgi:hypothetical protein